MVVAATICVLLVAAGIARAEERDPRDLEAKTACLSGHFEKGIEILARLFAETNDPTYIYNQGRCFEQNGRASEAVLRFREYLRKTPNISAEENAQVQAHIKEMESLHTGATVPDARRSSVSESGDRSNVGATKMPGSGPTAAPTVKASSDARVADLAYTGPSQDGDGRAWRIAGIATVSGGVVLLGGGVLLGLAARSADADVSRQFDPDRDAAGKRFATLQWVGYGLGAAAIATGTLLFAHGYRTVGTNETGSGAHVAMTPGGLLVRGQF